MSLLTDSFDRKRSHVSDESVARSERSSINQLLDCLAAVRSCNTVRLEALRQISSRVWIRFRKLRDALQPRALERKGCDESYPFGQSASSLDLS